MKKKPGEELDVAGKTLEIIEENFELSDDGVTLSMPDIPDELPLIELRNNVCFPYTVMPIAIGRERTKRLVKALEGDSPLVVITSQKNPSAENPSRSGLYPIGTLAKVRQSISLPGQTALVVVGLARVRIEEFTSRCT